MQVVLNECCTHSKTARAAVKEAVFPNPWSPSQTQQGGAAVTVEATVEAAAGMGARQAARGPMDPTDAPEGTLRARLIGLMTSLDSSLKRCAAELLFLLCDEDRKCYSVPAILLTMLCSRRLIMCHSLADEFTGRTGFGNAVALLQIKGLC
jgi:hypothetical protein